MNEGKSYCGLCNKLFSTKSNFVRHQKNFHNSIDQTMLDSYQSSLGENESDKSDSSPEETNTSDTESEDSDSVWRSVFEVAAKTIKDSDHGLTKGSDVLEDGHKKYFLKTVGNVVQDMMDIVDKLRNNDEFETIQEAADEIKEKNGNLTDQHVMETAFKKHRYLLEPILKDNVDIIHSVLFPDDIGSDEELA